MKSQPTQTDSVRAASTEELYDRFHAELWRFVRARVASDAEAQDILQTTYLRAHAHLTDGDPPDNPRAWLYQISRNLIVDTARRAARGRELEDALATDPSATTAERDAADLDGGALSLVARALPLFVNALDEPYRRALKATEIEGLTQTEAARREGISISGMKSRVQRGRRLLRASLERCCEFYTDATGRMISCAPRTDCPCRESA